MNANYFRKDKIAVLGAIKAQLPFSGGKYQLLLSWYEIPFPTIFYRLNFQLPHPNRSNSVSSQKYPLKGNERIRETRKLHSKPFTYFFSLGAPDYFSSVNIFQQDHFNFRGTARHFTLPNLTPSWKNWKWAE